MTEAPGSNIQTPEKLPISNLPTRLRRLLQLNVWCFSGALSLGFGAFCQIVAVNSAIALHRRFPAYSAPMSSGRKQYPFHLIEPKWQALWDEQQTFRAFNP